MKNYTLLFFAAFVLPFPSSSQTVEDDFEGNGTIPSWYGDDCQIDDGFANPFLDGANGSATVMQYSDQGGAYANVRFDIPSNFDLSNDHTFTLKIYVPASSITGAQTNQVSLKLQDGTLGEPWSTQTEVIKAITLDQWQTITFDFENDPFINLDAGSSDPINRDDLNRVLIQVNGENNSDQVVAYFDDFSYDGTIVLPEPDPVYDMLIWSDEFNSDGAIDSNKWFHQTQLPPSGSWFNNEVQHYTNRLENSFVEDGKLHVMAKKETFTNQGETKQYTSARLNSKFAFTYGKVEVRAILPTGVGTWPAIWTLGKNIDEDGGYWDEEYGAAQWPACGEIDIMEHWGNNQNYVSSALHTPSSFGATVNHGGLVDENVSTEFHTYSLVWTPEKMDFSLDGYVFYTYAPEDKNMDTWPYIAEQYILLNVAMQGAIDSNFTESPMIIDYVRIYQEDTTGSPAGLKDNSSGQIEFFPNPVNDQLQIRVNENLIGSKATFYSAIGQRMESFMQNSTIHSLDLAHYPAGVYFVNFETAGQVASYKLIKQ
ncbi:family 16 glycosylhydrolase [Salibacteraceae bacterium]|jgi:beta-glucanase (GH16 family)|nr:family 16 glycosylhydrolase [Salibacteraceae bacterium]MDB0002455.1 family 16 glycosylhydrolase [Salibacteraceae bacterium]MDB4104603.1 family 16 glycosylhydrolase [Salibacteraceae bacterium]MDB9709417.1 family 16 glycosylhydrolase [Salibacteraceae bacterium]MDC1303936.1 family 16 glycosylhydrolase [Salibacteraceae bacterium]